MAIDTLIIGGINTHACIRTSAVDAFMRDYRVIIPEECVASYNDEYHHESMEYFSKRIAMVLDLEEMIKRIEQDNLHFKFFE
jgi:isochorismate hydrolase